jgi:hypothetical protein
MREKYLNMSGYEIQEMKPVDILNITFEHNKKKELIRDRTNLSSSSSSRKNEVSINILEEPFCLDNDVKSDQNIATNN